MVKTSTVLAVSNLKIKEIQMKVSKLAVATALTLGTLTAANASSPDPYQMAAMCVGLMANASNVVGPDTVNGKRFTKAGEYFAGRLQYGLQKNLITEQRAATLLQGSMAKAASTSEPVQTQILDATKICFELAVKLDAVR
jgi:hypothetical protein